MLLRLILCWSLLLVASDVRAETIHVFAAASTRAALEDAVEPWQAQTEHKVVISAAGSSVLARQIDHGAPADVFLSANVAWMDWLEARDRIAVVTRRDLISNRMVLIAHGPDGSPVDLSPDLDLLAMMQGRPLAMALVDAIPAGIYGKAALEHFGLWESVRANTVQADNVRTALSFVRAGEAALGIVYATDAIAEPGVSTIATFPKDSHPPVIYPIAALSGRDSPGVLDLLRYLSGQQAQAVFARHGFLATGD